MTIWPFEPDWRDKDYRVAYEFLTGITRSSNGKEQRRALRTSPRKSIDHSVLLNDARFRQFKDLMWGAQDDILVLPELTRFTETTVATEISDTDMVFTSVPSWLVPGAAVTVGALGVFEGRLVDSVDGDVVTFQDPSTMAWAVGARLYPALTGYLATELSTPRVTNAVAQLDMRFAVDPGSEPLIAPPAAAVTFNGREVFLKKPNWAAAVDVATGHEADTLDYGTGPVLQYSAVAFGYNVKKATYVNRNTEQAQAIVDFFFRMKGQQGEFYMPTWEYDFQPKVAASSGSSTMRVAGTAFADSYEGSTVHKAMFVQKLDGTVLLRKVLSVAPISDGGGNDSLITIEGTWSATISQATIVMCGWMPVWRLASDTLVMEWLTDTVAQTQLAVRTLEDLPVETP